MSVKPSEERTELRNGDFLSGLLLAFVAAFAIYEAAHLPFGSIRAPDAGFFPISLSVLLLLASLAIMLRSFARGGLHPVQFSTRSLYVLLAAVALMSYAFVLESIGFVIATTIILLLMMRGFGGMSLRNALLVAVPAVIVAYFGFLQLGVPLPTGILPF